MGEPTAIFSIHDKKDYEIHEIVQQVYDALKEKGFNNLQLHIIGALQSNKVKKACDIAPKITFPIPFSFICAKSGTR